MIKCLTKCLIKKQNPQKNQNSYLHVLALFYDIDRVYGDSKHCRRVLQRALNSVTDWPESIVDAYINFERLEGKTLVLPGNTGSKFEGAKFKN